MKCQNKTNITLALPVELLILLWEWEKNYPQKNAEECKHKMKKTKMTKFTEAELTSESDSVFESDTELELKSDFK